MIVAVRRARLGLLLSTALAAVCLTGCGGSGPSSAATCLPSRLTAAPAQIMVGRTVTVSSSPFECDARYPQGKRYALTLALVGRSAPVELGTVPVGVDGSFRAEVPIPAAATPGAAYVLVRGSAFDEPCDDTGGSCADYSVGITLLPSGG